MPWSLTELYMSLDGTWMNHYTNLLLQRLRQKKYHDFTDDKNIFNYIFLYESYCIFIQMFPGV